MDLYEIWIHHTDPGETYCYEYSEDAAINLALRASRCEHYRRAYVFRGRNGDANRTYLGNAWQGQFYPVSGR